MKPNGDESRRAANVKAHYLLRQLEAATKEFVLSVSNQHSGTAAKLNAIEAIDPSDLIRHLAALDHTATK